MTSRVRCSRSEHRPLRLKVDDVLPRGQDGANSWNGSRVLPLGVVCKCRSGTSCPSGSSHRARSAARHRDGSVRLRHRGCLAAVRRSAPRAPANETLLVLAGVHGDEQAGALAIPHVLERAWPPRDSWLSMRVFTDVSSRLEEAARDDLRPERSHRLRFEPPRCRRRAQALQVSGEDCQERPARRCTLRNSSWFGYLRLRSARPTARS